MLPQLLHQMDMLVYGGVLDWLNTKIRDATTTIRALVTLACIGGLLYLMIKAKFQVKAVIVGLCVAALVFWAVGLDGYKSLAALFAPEFDN
ncbi:MAG: hypothetical protein GEV10_25625 [Streptosporangiales bacterium]|nr:hypothetical protein [Streptosporangiales bacterium]